MRLSKEVDSSDMDFKPLRNTTYAFLFYFTFYIWQLFGSYDKRNIFN